MTADQLVTRIQQAWPPFICDVRSGREYASGHIPGAVHIPLSSILSGRAALPDNREEPLVITCEHGPRAVLAMNLLAWKGYRNTEFLEGHMSAWRRNGLPVQKETNRT